MARMFDFDSKDVGSNPAPVTKISLQVRGVTVTHWSPKPADVGSNPSGSAKFQPVKKFEKSSLKKYSKWSNGDFCSKFCAKSFVGKQEKGTKIVQCNMNIMV